MAVLVGGYTALCAVACGRRLSPLCRRLRTSPPTGAWPCDELLDWIRAKAMLKQLRMTSVANVAWRKVHAIYCPQVDQAELGRCVSYPVLANLNTLGKDERKNARIWRTFAWPATSVRSRLVAPQFAWDACGGMPHVLRWRILDSLGTATSASSLSTGLLTRTSTWCSRSVPATPCLVRDLDSFFLVSEPVHGDHAFF